MKKDYYEILGIAKDADAAQIKKAYRSLALKYHPDRVGPEGKKDAEEKFKEISEAYGILSDPQKRKMYDQYGHSGIDQRYTAEDIFRGADFSGFNDLGDIFNQFFGGDALFDMFGGGGGRSGSRRQRRGRDIQYELAVSLEEAFTGIRKKIKVPRHEPCSQCQGSGAKPGSQPKTCATCHGQGQVVVSSGFFRMAQTCSVCRGEGKVISDPCPQCQGQGLVRMTRQIDVNIPAGVDNDTRLRVRGEGEVGLAGAGDLYLYLRVQPHASFQRDGKDIYMEQATSFVTAALGGDIKVLTLGGAVEMRVPAGTQSGKVFRLKGKGMPDIHGGGPGDQYVKVMIRVPTRLSAQQRTLLEEFAQVSGESYTKGGESFKEKIKNVFK